MTPPLRLGHHVMVQRSRKLLVAAPLRLALQGGGAHGAFTWGVLDRLLEVPGLRIEAISATSSGAMNACALAQGWHLGGAEGARAALEDFWTAVARRHAVPYWWAALARPLYQSDYWVSPRAPLPFNPLRGLVEEFFQIGALRRSPVRLLLTATRVRDGGLAEFSGEGLTHDALLASACLPHWFPAVEIDGETYWDGGYAGNPALEPLLREAGGDDLLCVLLQPLERGRLPQSAADIAERAAQLGFGAVFLRELRDLAQARRRLSGRLWLRKEERRLARLRLHMIAPAGELVSRDGNSAVDVRLQYLRSLQAQGRAAADAWCEAHCRDFGRQASFRLANRAYGA